MGMLWALLISLILNFHCADKPIVSKEGNVTTIIINGQVYKRAESDIGEAWSDLGN